MLSEKETRSENERLIDIYKLYLYREIPIDELERTRQAILGDTHLMSLYGAHDLNTILNRYYERVRSLSEKLKDPDKLQNIANCLEYMRFACMDENFCELKDIRYFEALSDSPISSALIGKGTAISQSRFMKDLLQDGIQSIVSRVDFYEYPQVYMPVRSDECLLIQTKKGKMFVNPTRYTGSDYHNLNVVARIYNDQIKELPIPEEKRKLARDRSSGILIDELGIREILSSITTSDMDIKAKNDAFVKFIRQNMTKYRVPVKFHGIVINGRMLELPKLLELFYIASGIPYKIAINSIKEKNVYSIETGNETIVTDGLSESIGKDKGFDEDDIEIS